MTEEEKDAGGVEPKGGTGRFLEIVFVAVVAAVISGSVSYKLVLDEVHAELQSLKTYRPPVAVIDYGPVIMAVKKGVSPSDIEPVFVELKEKAEKLAANGFLVVNRASLETVPEHLLIEASSKIEVAPKPEPALSALPELTPEDFINGLMEARRQ